MSIKTEVIRGGIKLLGGIQKGEFTTASGQRANRKVEMDVLNRSRVLRGLVVAELALRAHAHEPDLIIPMPYGADELGRDVASRLDVGYTYLDWVDKTPGKKSVRPRSEIAAKLITRAERIVLVDDVFTVGSSLLAAWTLPLLQHKIVAGEVVWQRGLPGAHQALPFPVGAIVEEYIPLWEDQK